MLLFAIVITVAGGTEGLHLEMLPWNAQTSYHVLLFGGIVGLAVTMLAIFNKLRPGFFLWAAAVTWYLIKGFYMGGYRFTFINFNQAGYLLGGSVIALLGAFIQMFRGGKR